MTRRGFMIMPAAGFLVGSCGGGTSLVGSSDPPVSETQGVGNATALANLSVILTLAHRLRPGARVYKLQGEADPMTGRILPDSRWLYLFIFSGAAGSGDFWQASPDGKVAYLGESAFSTSEITSSIEGSLSIDSDRALQVARQSGLDGCARIPEARALTTYHWEPGFTVPLCRINISGRVFLVEPSGTGYFLPGSVAICPGN